MRAEGKSFVIAFTPSPALDLSGTVDRLKPNEKSYVYDDMRSPGGNAINVARILTRLKTPVLATGFLGGSTGGEIKSLLDKEGVKNKFIGIKGHSRICVTVSNKADHKQTRLTFPGPHISRSERDDLIHFFKNLKQSSLLVIGGSLPPGLQATDIIRVIRIARRRGIRFIVDSPAKILRKLVSEGPFFIKPNLDEFQELTQTKVKSIRGVQRAAEFLTSKIPYVCVSSVEGGALLITGESCYFGRIPKVQIRSSVGAGDSMVGAMVAQLYKENLDAADVLRWGLAAAAATLEERGTAFGSAKRIYSLYNQTSVGFITK